MFLVQFHFIKFKIICSKFDSNSHHIVQNKRKTQNSIWIFHQNGFSICSLIWNATRYWRSQSTTAVNTTNRHTHKRASKASSISKNLFHYKSYFAPCLRHHFNCTNQPPSYVIFSILKLLILIHFCRFARNRWWRSSESNTTTAKSIGTQNLELDEQKCWSLPRFLWV